MFQIDDDMTIYITRGDIAFFTVTAENNGEKHKFLPGDVVRIKVFAKKDATNVAFQKDFPVLEESEKVDILLTEAETKIGDVISKPVDYWYEIELNPYSNPQTIVGYDDDGAKIFKLFPEGRDLGPDTVPEDVPVVDTELSLTSQKPVENQAVTRAIVKLSEDVKNEVENHAETLAKMEAEVDEALNKAYTETDRVSHELAIERARINNLVANAGDTDNNAELIDIRTGADGTIYETAGEAVRGQVANLTNTTEFLKDVDGILKCATGLEEKKDVKLSFLGLYSGKTRAKTDFFGTTYATHISIAEVAGYQTSVFYYTGDNYVSSPWNTKIDRLDISGCDKAYVAYRKSDDSALTDADANNIQSAMKAFLFYDGGLKSDLVKNRNYTDSKCETITINGNSGDKMYKDITSEAVETVNGYFVAHDGVILESYAWNYYKYTVIPHATYRIKTYIVSLVRAINIYDVNNNLISIHPSEESAGEVIELEVVMPDNANYILCNHQTGEPFELYLVTQNYDVYASNNYLYGKKLVTCGDSITDAINPNGGYFKNYGEIVAERNGMTFVKDGIGGSTMANINEGSFSNTRYLNHTDFDYLTIWFGWNDGAYSELGTIDDTVDTTFYGAYKKVLNHYVTTYPTKKIGVIVPYMSNADYQQAVREVSAMMGVPCLDLPNYNQCSLIWGTANNAQIARRNALTYDTTHPNQEGYEFIATMYENFLRSL